MPGDEQFEPGSHRQVLRNRLGITNTREVDVLEASLLRIAQTRSFHQIDSNSTFSVRLIRDLHRSCLAPLYDFAKGSVTFAPVAYMDTTLSALDILLAKYTPCKYMHLDLLVQAIAKVHVERILAHHFREDNGRLARWVADLMALQAGYPPLDWGFAEDVDHKRKEYYAALRRGFVMDFTASEQLVKAALQRAAHSFESPRD